MESSDWVAKNLAVGGIHLALAPLSGLGHPARLSSAFSLPSF